jgi:hypothetical protein
MRKECHADEGHIARPAENRYSAPFLLVSAASGSEHSSIGQLLIEPRSLPLAALTLLFANIIPAFK